MQILALFCPCMKANEMQAFEDPRCLFHILYCNDPGFTLFVLIALRKQEVDNQPFIYLAIISTLYYVFFVIYPHSDLSEHVVSAASLCYL